LFVHCLDVSRLRKRRGAQSKPNGKKPKSSQDSALSKQSLPSMPSPIQKRRPLSRLDNTSNLQTSTPLPVSTDREPFSDSSFKEPSSPVHELQSTSLNVPPSSDLSSSSIKQYHSLIVCNKREKTRKSKHHNRRKSCHAEEFDEWVKQVNKEFELVEEHELSVTTIC
jgi:hypothetical protein